MYQMMASKSSYALRTIRLKLRQNEVNAPHTHTHIYIYIHSSISLSIYILGECAIYVSAFGYLNSKLFGHQTHWSDVPNKLFPSISTISPTPSQLERGNFNEKHPWYIIVLNYLYKTFHIFLTLLIAEIVDQNKDLFLLYSRYHGCKWLCELIPVGPHLTALMIDIVNRSRDCFRCSWEQVVCSCKGHWCLQNHRTEQFRKGHELMIRALKNKLPVALSKVPCPCHLQNPVLCRIVVPGVYNNWQKYSL